MKKRPYFIQDDYGDNFAPNMLLYQDMLKHIGDLIQNVKLNSYHLQLLIQDYHEMLTMPRFGNISDLPIANRNPISTWQIIARIGIEIIERNYLMGRKQELFEALELTMHKIGNLQKVEYFSQKDVPEIEVVKNLEDLDKPPKVNPEDRLRKMLLYYHDLYEGSYKIGLSLFHFLCDLMEGKYKSSKPFETYLEKEDVSHKIIQLTKYSSEIKLQKNIQWLLIGADSHVRNAIAHKRWEFKEGKVILRDRDGWEKELNYFEIEDMIRSLKIALKGMQTAMTISFCKYMDEISQPVQKRILDEESIQGIMYLFANENHFVLDDLEIKKDLSINCRLKEQIIPQNREMFAGFKTGAVKIDLPPIPDRTYRVKSFVASSLPAIWNYKKISLDVYNFEKKNVGRMEINLEEWSKMYQSKKVYAQNEYDTYVTMNTIIEDDTKEN